MQLGGAAQRQVPLERIDSLSGGNDRQHDGRHETAARALYSSSNLAVRRGVFLSAALRSSERDLAPQADAEAITKPITIGQTRSRIREVLTGLPVTCGTTARARIEKVSRSTPRIAPRMGTDLDSNQPASRLAVVILEGTEAL